MLPAANGSSGTDSSPIESLTHPHKPAYNGRNHPVTRHGRVVEGVPMIRKLIILAILAGILYGAYRVMDDWGFLGARGKKRQTFEDVQKKALE